MQIIYNQQGIGDVLIVTLDQKIQKSRLFHQVTSRKLKKKTQAKSLVTIFFRHQRISTFQKLIRFYQQTI